MTNLSKYRLLVASGTRADWGLLQPVADELRRRGHEVTVAATNMHLRSEFGNTVNEIRADGFDPAEIPSPGDSPAEITASATSAFAGYFRENLPDAVIILGDRFEMLGVATAALLEGIPIVHIAGGTVSEGAFDDAIRHSITKMAVLHFPETELCRRRILRMGENPADVITAGAAGVWNILHIPLLSKAELEADLNFRFTKKTFMATLHPATLDPIPPLQQMNNFLGAFEEMMRKDSEVSIILTYPNNDCASPEVIRAMQEFADAAKGRVLLIKSLGRRRYLSALPHCAGVVGNSSSGIVEVPSTGIPTLDIGMRQKGREHGPSVIHCLSSREEILQGLRIIQSDSVRRIASMKQNPYHRDGTPSIIADGIESFEFTRYPVKKFYNEDTLSDSRTRRE